jgi:predicted RNase H-like HicB family nuclease
MEKPQKLTLTFQLRADKYFASVVEYPFIYAEGYTINDAFDSLMEFLKENKVYDDGIPVYIDERCQEIVIDMNQGKDTILQMEKMKNRLHFGYIEMSGLQSQSDLSEEEVQQGEEKLKDVIRDIAASFGYNVELSIIKNENN